MSSYPIVSTKSNPIRIKYKQGPNIDIIEDTMNDLLLKNDYVEIHDTIVNMVYTGSRQLGYSIVILYKVKHKGEVVG